jgi:hypothetical protein
MERSMSRSFSNGERQRLDDTARQIVDAHPRIIDLIARGADANPQGIAVAYLRTALDENSDASIKKLLEQLPLAIEIASTASRQT